MEKEHKGANKEQTAVEAFEAAIHAAVEVQQAATRMFQGIVEAGFAAQETNVKLAKEFNAKVSENVKRSFELYSIPFVAAARR